MGVTWEEAKKEINRIDTNERKLEFVLNSIWEANEIKDEDIQRIPIFCGQVQTHGKKRYIYRMYTILGSPLKHHPYSENTFRVCIERIDYPEDTKVVFTPCIGDRSDKEHLISADPSSIRTFDELGISDIDGLITGIIKNRYSELYRDKLIEYNARQKWPEDVDKAEKLWDRIQNLKQRCGEAESKRNEYEQIKGKLQRLRQQYQLQYPDELENNSSYLNWEILSNQSENVITIVQNRLRYKYDPNIIISFMMSLHTSQIIALCGKPGSGKTTFAGEMARALGAKFHLISVQNNWTDQSDILGFFNPTNGSYQGTDFLDALIEAKDEEEYCNEHDKKSRLHIICLDEMNLARVEYYFATFLSLLQREPENRTISILPWYAKRNGTEAVVAEPRNNRSRYEHIYIPSNVRFVGTMNMDDTAQSLSPKVIDRCFFIEFNNDATYEGGKKQDYNMTDAHYPVCECQ